MQDRRLMACERCLPTGGIEVSKHAIYDFEGTLLFAALPHGELD